jgi:hypothetical protein
MFGLAILTGLLGTLQLFKDTQCSNNRLTSLEQQLQALQRLPGPQGIKGPQGPAG